MANEYASIPEPTADPQSLLASVSALKQTVEALAGQRGTDASTAVTQQDLIDQSNLAGVTPAVAQKNIGLVPGTAATNIVQLDASGKLPAVDGSQLTGLTSKALSVVAQTFTASGTYTPTAGMVYCIVECWGGGGAGGSGVSTTLLTMAAGGGAGGYSRKTVSAATVGVSQVVTIGTAGAAAATGNNAGGAGGDTSVGALCIGKGGSGGPGNAGATNTSFGAGGVAGTGDIAAPGQNGTCGYSAASGPSFFPQSEGGSTLVGSGGTNDRATNPKTGTAATGRGAGGSGGYTVAGGNVAGGAGTAGLVVVTEYVFV